MNKEKLMMELDERAGSYFVTLIAIITVGFISFLVLVASTSYLMSIISGIVLLISILYFIYNLIKFKYWSKKYHHIKSKIEYEKLLQKELKRKIEND